MPLFASVSAVAPVRRVVRELRAGQDLGGAPKDPEHVDNVHAGVITDALVDEGEDAGFGPLGEVCVCVSEAGWLGVSPGTHLDLLAD